MTDDSTKILFVDNDPATLDALKLLLADEGWRCHFASSAAEALQQIEGEPMVLMVSNVEMPEMNGVELLAEVSHKHPETVRLLLTSGTKDDIILKALSAGHAQQIIPKPWMDQELKEIIRSALRQSTQQKKHSLKFQALINSMPLLPALPESYSQVQNCIMDDDVDIEKMADIIGQDVAMSSALLHWANSALFGQRFRVG
jgi:DNA-binding NtrC family response regulator